MSDASASLCHSAGRRARLPIHSLAQWLFVAALALCPRVLTSLVVDDDGSHVCRQRVGHGGGGCGGGRMGLCGNNNSSGDGQRQIRDFLTLPVRPARAAAAFAHLRHQPRLSQDKHTHERKGGRGGANRGMDQTRIGRIKRPAQAEEGQLQGQARPELRTTSRDVGLGAACWNVKLLVYDGEWERNRGNKSICSRQQLTTKVIIEIAIKLAEQLVGIVSASG